MSNAFFGDSRVRKGGLAILALISFVYLFNWKIALMLMIWIYVHENGHLWGMRRCGMKTKGFYFVPFFGGAAVPDEEFSSRKSEFIVAVMGPIWGTVPVIVAVSVGYFMNNPMLAAAGSYMAIISLLNLLPINPLDGGRMIRAITFSINSTLGIIIHALGISAMGLLAYQYGGGMVYLLLIAGVINFLFEFSEYRSKRDWEGNTAELTEVPGSVPESVVPMGKLAIFISSLVYVGIIILLLGLLVFTAIVPGTEMAMDALRNG